MPNYDLRCTACKTECNIRATMTEKAEKRIPCPSCGSYEMETLFKTPPAYVKGAGTPPVKCHNQRSCGTSCPHAG